MWLVDTETLKLQQVTDEKQHPFAILSHTWQAGEEVTFQDMQNFEAHVLEHKYGFYKIQNMCRIARRYWKYVWIDTCCIDKTSSAELTEAINSMFRYYRTAEACYVFLSDFRELPMRISEHDRLAQVARNLRNCKWFTRGWTLQELIAPSRLEFFDDHWNFLGEKADLESVLSEITNIDESVLRDSSRLYTIPVARRMSWASRRQTAREEDIAYCLLGIFDITMPLLYGEGAKAFLRLQQQIAMENSDLSIFAWEACSTNEVSSHGDGEARPEDNQYSGIFAETPGDFSKCATLRMHRAKLASMPGEMTMTNIGLRLSGAHITTHLDHIVLGLNCLRHSQVNGSLEWMGIYLVRFGSSYIRTRPSKVHTSGSKHFWGKAPRRETEPIYLQPRLLPDEVKRTNALLENIIILRYDENTKNSITARHGIPDAAYTETGPDTKSLQQASSARLRTILEFEERVNPFGGAVFRTNVAEEFDGIHLISLKTGPNDNNTHEVAVVVSLQWDGTELRLNYALYESTSDLMQYVDREPAPTEAAGYLERVQDYFLENRSISDLTGLLNQEKMPTTISIPGAAAGAPQRVISIERDRSLLLRTGGFFYLLLKTHVG
ncbi:hypothetical protein N0V93_004317 [Gnomoniopsis smithogilvyi]|uniref:Heterokaryon incompatibility domain-containing protein n=1 Tax=Gnomoniopsis smithogilvyi TaxID=1191159 RepID=A0A9W8YUK2_9PEZI|nr:hypothetical protein N0V93_004317 [Gnomoniopsis smithogilvyi]